MNDNELIELYFARNEKAIEQTQIKYENYCHAIAENILGDEEDSKECTNDTWLKVWNAIPPLRPDNLKLFIAKITRNLALNKYKERNASKRGAGNIGQVFDELAMCIPDEKCNVESEYLEKELSKLINIFLREQPIKRRNFFIRRYFFGESMEEVARRYDVSVGSVMTALSRTRKELKKYLEKEGY